MVVLYAVEEDEHGRQSVKNLCKLAGLMMAQIRLGLSSC
jgi:hypothetical protein